ncbi:MAG: hypothetical protein MZW92_17345 [Comamonadaceae bacterium]|nr:hypothetical protein [Comamonadaceae bacterium]
MGVALGPEHAADHHLRLREALRPACSSAGSCRPGRCSRTGAPKCALRGRVQRAARARARARARSSRWHPARRRGRRGGR